MAKTSLPQVTKELEKDLKYARELEAVIGRISGGGSGGGGFAGGSGNMMTNSLGRVSFAAMGVKAVAGAAGLGYNMMPQLGDVVSRSTAFYNASLLQGGQFTQNQMYNSMRSSLGKFGIQDKMSTAILSQGFGERGVQFGSQYGNQLASSVGGAVKYLNMDTQRAFSALEGLTAGAGGQSGTLLRTMGIFTANPYSGKEYSQQQIFEQMHSRLSAGRGKASVEDVQTSFRRGMLGSYLKDSGLTQDQQQMYYMWELAKAGGVKMDLGDKKSMDAAMKQLKIRNPQLDLNAIQASEEGVLQAGTESMLGGLKNSVGSIEALNVAAGKLAETFGGLKAYIDSVTSTRAGGAVGDALGSGLGALGGFAVGKMGSGGGGGGGAALLASGKAGAANLFKGMGPAVKGLGIAGAAVTAATAGVSGYAAGASGQSYNPWDNFLSGAMSGAMIGAVAGAPAGGIGAVPGAIIGGLVGGFGAVGIGAGANAIGAAGRGGPNRLKEGGGTQTAATKSTETAAKKAGSRWVSPTSGTVTDGFGHRVPPMAGASSYHKGIDIANRMGTTVKAAADGKVLSVSRSNSGFGNRVRILHHGGYQGKTVTTGYAHLSSIKVSEGAKVKAGDTIGGMGASGMATGPHLHFDVAMGKGENYFDPRGLGINFGAGKPSVLPVGNKTAGNSPTTTLAASGTTSTPSTGSSSGWAGTTAVGASTSVNYGVQTVDYLSSGASVGNLFGSIPSAPTTGTGTGASESSAGESSSGRGGPASVTMMGTTGSSTLDTVSSYGSFGGGKASGGGNNVTINLSISKASESEARRFAGIVKTMLESDANILEAGKR